MKRQMRGPTKRPWLTEMLVAAVGISAFGLVGCGGGAAPESETTADILGATRAKAPAPPAAPMLTWQTVEDFQYAGSTVNATVGLAADPSGNIYSASYSNGTLYHAVVMKSSDGGATWSAPIDDFSFGGNNGAKATDITTDAAGNVYTTGFYYTASDYHWYTRLSQDGGATWTTVDDFTLGGSVARPNAITVDASGNIYVAGNAMLPGGTKVQWIVRKGTPLGGSWTTVDNFNLYGTGSAVGIVSHPTKGIFAVGTALGGGSAHTVPQWVVRRSTNGGSTWSTVDTFLYNSNGAASSASGVGLDAAGNIYVSGTGSTTHLIVRKSSTGTSWSTANDFTSSAYANALLGTRIAKDSHGNLFVGGYGVNLAVGTWIVRELSASTGSWSTVDSFQYVPLDSTESFAMAADAAGHVFAGGNGYDGSHYHALIRKATP